MSEDTIFAKVSRREFVELGSRLRAGNLLQQAGYTMEIERGVRDALSAILPPGYVDEIEEARLEVEEGIRSRTNIAAEAKEATQSQNAVLRRIEDWRRRVRAISRIVERTGVAVSEGLTVMGRYRRTLATTLHEVEKCIGLLEQHRPDFGATPGIDGLIEGGKALRRELRAVDAEQEAKRLAHLPAAVADFYAAKGRLFAGLKMVNEAAKYHFADDPEAAGRFNLSILHKGRRASSAEPAADLNGSEAA